MYDAMRCAMNFGMDYYLFGADATRQEEMARRIINFFEKDGYTHARFNWDGTNPKETYTLGETGCNAVACYALLNNSAYTDQVKTNLKKAWNAQLMTGQYRYYDGILHYLSMLHLCGSFKIWKPRPEGSIYISTSIDDINTSNDIENRTIYDLQGRQTTGSQRGVYIIKNQNGETRKVMRK
jgi:oligosaccharide reducing-end xylanase